MPIRDALLPEYDHEIGTTRRLLERTPEAELAWKPHDKSMTLGELASHLVAIPRWCNIILERPEFDMGGSADDRPAVAAGSRAELLAGFDSGTAAARAAIAAAGDPELLALWTFKKGGHEIFTLPRVAALRSLVMSHLVHHRGQLSVYLRLKDVPLPSIYGPTADES